MAAPAEAAGQVKEPKETERKFTVATMPDITGSEGAHLEQGYIVIGADGSEVRVRSEEHSDGVHHVLTAKSKGTLVRGERNVPISTGQFTELWPVTEGKRVAKMRHQIPLLGAAVVGETVHVAELDIYEGNLDTLVTVEVEFSDKDAAEAFQPPEWFGEEVTEDKRYKNQQLALHGIPEGYIPPVPAA